MYLALVQAHEDAAPGVHRDVLAQVNDLVSRRILSLQSGLVYGSSTHGWDASGNDSLMASALCAVAPRLGDAVLRVPPKLRYEDTVELASAAAASLGIDMSTYLAHFGEAEAQ